MSQQFWTACMNV